MRGCCSLGKGKKVHVDTNAKVSCQLQRRYFALAGTSGVTSCTVKADPASAVRLVVRGRCPPTHSLTHSACRCARESLQAAMPAAPAAASRQSHHHTHIRPTLQHSDTPQQCSIFIFLSTLLAIASDHLAFFPRPWPSSLPSPPTRSSLQAANRTVGSETRLPRIPLIQFPRLDWVLEQLAHPLDPNK